MDGYTWLKHDCFGLKEVKVGTDATASMGSSPEITDARVEIGSDAERLSMVGTEGIGLD